MLFSKIDFTDADVRQKLDGSRSRHESTLEHYYLNYNNALRSVITKGLGRSYAFNDKSRGILFLLRHSLELCLKLNLERKGSSIANSHDFAELTDAFADPSDIPAAIQAVMSRINYDTSGANFRYLTEGAAGKRYFTYRDRIELAGILQSYHSVNSSPAFELGDIAPVFNYENRRIVWAMTLHMGESIYLGHIKSQFSAVTE